MAYIYGQRAYYPPLTEGTEIPAPKGGVFKRFYRLDRRLLWSEEKEKGVELISVTGGRNDGEHSMA